MSGLFGFFKSKNDNVKRSSEEQLADIAHEFVRQNKSKKHSHSFTMTIFHKITKSAKLVILLIIPTYAKISQK
jgi:hypothetical protein